jgi:hypothetical protein
MLFRAVEIGRLSSEDITGEYHKKINTNTSVVWEIDANQAHLIYLNNQPTVIEHDFPQNHSVEEID